MANLNAPSEVEREVQRIAALLGARRFEDAAAAATVLRTRVPQNRDVLLLLASAQRLADKVPAALETLTALEQLHPRYSRLFQERGHCHVLLRQAPEAIEAFLAAVNINAALPSSWNMLAGLYRMGGQEAEAAQAEAHVATLSNLPPPLVTATGQFSDGDLGAAEQGVRAFLRQSGQHVEALRLLGRISMERGSLEDAHLLLEAVLARAPQYHAARLEYAQVLTRRHLYREAQAQVQALLAVSPEDRSYRTLYAMSCVGLGDSERALELYRELLPGAARPAELHLSIAHSLKTLGRQDEAIEEYRQAVAARADYGDAYWSLANLKTYRFSDAQVAQMRAVESQPSTSASDRCHLCFALGKALEDRHEYEDSFASYARGNELKRAMSPYQAAVTEARAQRQIAACTPALVARHKGGGDPARDPIFILGMPRSGSTLIEQILASHSQVEGTHELADVPRTVVSLEGRATDAGYPRYPAVLATLGAAQFGRLGAKYLCDTAGFRSGRAHFIDKMPNNFWHVGLIHLMLPNAVIIDARREPMACCFGNFKQLFASGQEFSYTIDDIAHYYRTYLTVMRHWDSVLPGRVLRVQHEDLVEDLEGGVRRILAHCDLAFEPACLEFHRTQRSVRTASSEQVRQPLSRAGLQQWRHFEPWLAPLREALGPDTLAGYRS